MICKHKYAVANRTCRKEIYKDNYCKSHYIIPKDIQINNKKQKNTNDGATSSNQLVDLSINDIQTTFKYNNLDILCIKINEYDIWFKAKEAAEGMDYKDTSHAIQDHVFDEHKKSLDELIKLNPVKMTGFEKMKGNEKNSIFINEAGLYCLIMSSKKPEAKAFKKYVTEIILPSIRKTGSYNVNQITDQKHTIIKSFYSENMLIDFDKKNVVYIGCFIYNNKLYYKFGLSNDVYRRDYKEHKKTFENFEMIFVMECDNNDNVELAFKKEMTVKKVLLSLDFNDKKQIEIIDPTENFTIENVLDYLKYLVENMPLNAIIKKDNKIKELEDKLKNNNELEKYEIEQKYKAKSTVEIELGKYKIENDFNYKKYKLELTVGMEKKDNDKITSLHNLHVSSKRELLIPNESLFGGENESNNIVNEYNDDDDDETESENSDSDEYIINKKELKKIAEQNKIVINSYKNEKIELEEKYKALEKILKEKKINYWN